METSRRGCVDLDGVALGLSQRVTVPSVTHSPRAGAASSTVVAGVARGRAPEHGRLAADAGSAWPRRRDGLRRLGVAVGGVAAAPRRARRGPGPRRCSPAARHRAAAVVATVDPPRPVADHREVGADRDGVVLLDKHLLKGAGDRRGDLGVDLVGGDFEQRLVDRDLVTDLLEPSSPCPRSRTRRVRALSRVQTWQVS